jgi:hypothetical protein
VAVKVTEVPEQMVLSASLEAIVTEGVTVGLRMKEVVPVMAPPVVGQLRDEPEKPLRLLGAVAVEGAITVAVIIRLPPFGNLPPLTEAFKHKKLPLGVATQELLLLAETVGAGVGAKE